VNHQKASTFDALSQGKWSPAWLVGSTLYAKPDRAQPTDLPLVAHAELPCCHCRSCTSAIQRFADRALGNLDFSKTSATADVITTFFLFPLNKHRLCRDPFYWPLPHEHFPVLYVF
jgi:hypothetical protein